MGKSEHKLCATDGHPTRYNIGWHPGTAGRKAFLAKGLEII